MAKLTKTTTFKVETPMDKTNRIVREIVVEEAEQRQIKIDRLRDARLEREVNTPTKAVTKR